MAAPESSSDDGFSLKCICHDDNVKTKKKTKTVIPFTVRTWASFLKSVGIWQGLIGNRADIAKDFIAQHGGYNDITVPRGAGCHERCHTYFTDSTKQERGRESKRKHEAASTSKEGALKYKMANQSITNPSIQLLQFCEPCGLKRVCDVTDQLQKIFTDRCLESNICAICQKKVFVDVELTNESPLKVIKEENLGKHVNDISVAVGDQNTEKTVKGPIWSPDKPQSRQVGVSQGEDDDDNENYTLSDHDEEEDDNEDRSKNKSDGTNSQSVKSESIILTKPDEQASKTLVIEQKQVKNIEGSNLTKPDGTNNDTAKSESTISTRPDEQVSKSIAIEQDQFKNHPPAALIERFKQGRILAKLKHNKRYKHHNTAVANTLKPIRKRRKRMTADRKTVYESLLSTAVRGRSTRLSTGAIQATKYAAMVHGEALCSDEKDSGRSDNDCADGDIDPDIKELMEMEEMSESEFSEEDVGLQLYGARYLDPEVLEHLIPLTDDANIAKTAYKFECKYCKVQYQFLDKFLKHVTSHTGEAPPEKPYLCDHCGENFAYKPFYVHKKRHRNRTFKCTYRGCQYSFREKGKLRKHLAVHRGRKPYFCKVCGIGFYNEAEQLAHALEHVNEMYTCKECNMVFPDMVKFKRHHQQTHVVKKVSRKLYRCNECHNCEVTTKDCLQRHKLEYHGTKPARQNSKKCKSVFPAKALLQVHLDQDTCEPEVDIDIKKSTKYVDPRLVAMIGKPRSVDKPFRCKHCRLAEFESALVFLKHLQNKHPDVECPVIRPFCCDQCDAKFKSRNKLSTHFHVHSEVRPFTCTIESCKKTFKTVSLLNQHTGRAHEEWKFMCSTCGKKKASLGKLKHHENTVHLKLRPAKCPQCDKRFQDKTTVKEHIRRVHQGLKPWICEVCGKAYKEKSELKVHNYSHTGEKPFACDQCEYRCVRPDYLRKHVRIHTGEKPHVCDVCEEAFAVRTSLVLHMKKHSGTPQRKSLLHRSSPQELSPSGTSHAANVAFPATSTSAETFAVDNIIATEFLKVSTDCFGQGST